MTKKNIVIFLSMVIFCASLAGGVEKVEKIGKDRILKNGREWQDVYTGYRVDESFIDTLKARIGDNLKIDVYLGLWCSDSRNNVPKFIKIIDTVGQRNTAVSYYNVARKASKDIKYFIKDLKVERVPTFIFSRGGKEIGRIVENPQKSLIEDFLEIIF